MGGGAGGEKSKGQENDEKQKTENLKTLEKKDKGKLREKVNFIARNREAAAAGGGGGQQGKMQRKGRLPGESGAQRQVIPREPKAPTPQMPAAAASKLTSKVTENCGPSKLTSMSETTNRVPSRSTSLRLQTSTLPSDRPNSSQAKASKQQASLQKPRPQSSRPQANRPKLGSRPSRRMKDESGIDLVTGMINRNLHHLLSQIFLQQVHFRCLTIGHCGNLNRFLFHHVMLLQSCSMSPSDGIFYKICFWKN